MFREELKPESTIAELLDVLSVSIDHTTNISVDQLTVHMYRTEVKSDYYICVLELLKMLSILSIDHTTAWMFKDELKQLLN